YAKAAKKTYGCFVKDVDHPKKQMLKYYF
ncbi:MAG: hypothetical protein JWQ57_461, partial [Mucilaginibacter sp.]|nr:hypothetical protein [Mucilaginibacter sp.]